MPIIEIPVHPLSKRMLEHEHAQDGVVVLSRTNTLFIVLTSMPRVRVPLTKIQQHLTEKVQIQCSAEIASGHIRHNLYAVGYALLKWHKERLHTLVTGAANAGQSAWSALDGYLTVYGVSEDEYSRETAYKNFQRYEWKYGKKIRQKRGQIRGQTGVKKRILSTPKTANQGRRKSHPILAENELEKIHQFIFDKFTGAGLQQCNNFEFWLRCYVYVRIGRYAMRDCGRLFKKQKTSVHRACVYIDAQRIRSKVFADILSSVPALPC